MRTYAGLFPALAVITSAVVGHLVGLGIVSFQSLLLLAIAFLLLFMLVNGNRAYETGFWAFIALFFIGYRTISIGSFLLHPLLVVLLATTVVVLFSKRQVKGKRTIQPFVIVFALIWVLGWAQGLQRGRAWDAMLGEALNVAAILPVFIVAREVLIDERQWRTALSLFYGVGTAIAVMGIAEYVIPDLGSRFLAGLITGNQTFYAGPEGFLRGTFAFFGAPVATFICMLALPIGFAVFTWARSPILKALIVATFITQAVAIYIGGYRSIWILATVSVAVTLILQRRIAIAVLASLGLAFLVAFAPEEGIERLNSVLRVIDSSGVADHSTQLRYERAVDAIVTGVNEPLGVGWAGSGWVHSDFAQFIGNLGIVTGIAIVLAFLWVVFRAVRVALTHREDITMAVLTGSLFGAGGLLLLQGIQVLPQLAFPVWFVIALALLRSSHLSAKRPQPDRAK